jgi:transcriptional regulator with XRE-family HTH domain
MTLGKRIKERRQALGLTQQQLAEALGVTPQHISVIEQDKRAPSLSSLARMAEQLGVTVDFLVAGKEGMVTSVITAIKADRRLNLKTKKALIALVEEFYRISPAE